jgi:hypothetical protein
MRLLVGSACVRRLACLPLFLLLLASGCGGGKTGTVTGKVRLNGQLVPGGHVNFFPEGSANSSAKISPIKEDGSYSVSGVPVGPAKISVQGVAGAAQIPNVAPPKGMEIPRSDRKAVYVPPKYSTTEQSGLKWDVKPGTQEYNIELTDR